MIKSSAKLFRRFSSLIVLIPEAVKEWQKDKVSLLAAALAYYTVFSLAPLLILATASVGSIFGADAVRGEIVGQIEALIGNEGAKLIETALVNTSKPEINSMASLFGIAVLLIGASGIFIQLQEALNIVWQVQVKPRRRIWQFIRKRLLSFSMVLASSFLLLVFLTISSILAALSHWETPFLPGLTLFWESLNFLLSFGIVTLLFALTYKYVPDVKIFWRDVWVGAIFTAFLFAIGKSILGLYLGRTSFSSIYGAAGSLVVILAWVYYSAQIFLFGAEITQVYARKYGSEIIPAGHAQAIFK